jgi:hypothetical protein
MAKAMDFIGNPWCRPVIKTPSTGAGWSPQQIHSETELKRNREIDSSRVG